MKNNRLFKNQFRFSDRILKNYGIKKFGGRKDFDFDGISNRKDCQPFNTFRQDFTPATKKQYISAAQKFGYENIKRLRFLGEGRDRRVYALDKDKVLKVAKNPKGIAQNSPEPDLENLYGLKHYESGKDYVVMERASPPGAATRNMIRRLKKHGAGAWKRDSGINWEAFTKAKVDTEILNYDLSMPDFLAKRNWGEKDEKPVLVDAGTLSMDALLYNRAEDEDEFEESKRERKMFTRRNPIPTKVISPTGVKGTVLDVRNIPPEYHGGKELMMKVKYNRGGTDYNVYPEDVKIVNPKDLKIPKQKERYEMLDTMPSERTSDMARTMPGEPGSFGEFLKRKEERESASIEKQEEWKEKPQEEKIVERITEPDVDRDTVPDEYDCEPENPEKQDEFTPEQKKEIRAIDWSRNQEGQVLGRGSFGIVYEVKDNPKYILKVPLSSVSKVSEKEREYSKYNKYKHLSLIAPTLKTEQGLVREKLKIIPRDVFDIPSRHIRYIKPSQLSNNQIKKVIGGVNQLQSHSLYLHDGLQMGIAENKKPYVYDIGELIYEKRIPEKGKDYYLFTPEGHRVEKAINDRYKKEFLNQVYNPNNKPDKSVDNVEPPLDLTSPKRIYKLEKRKRNAVSKNTPDVLQYDIIDKPIPIEENKLFLLDSASVEKQQEWKEKPVEEKIVDRIEKQDTDNDNTPNEYDCEPENPNEQHSYTKQYTELYQSKKKKPIQVTVYENPLGHKIKYHHYSKKYPMEVYPDIDDAAYFYDQLPPEYSVGTNLIFTPEGHHQFDIAPKKYSAFYDLGKKEIRYMPKRGGFSSFDSHTLNKTLYHEKGHDIGFQKKSKEEIPEEYHVALEAPTRRIIPIIKQNEKNYVHGYFERLFDTKEAPTKYGTKHSYEDFAESFAIKNTKNERQDYGTEYGYNKRAHPFVKVKDLSSGKEFTSIVRAKNLVRIKDLPSYAKRVEFIEKVYPDMKHQKSVRETIEEKQTPEAFIANEPNEPRSVFKPEGDWRDVFTGVSNNPLLHTGASVEKQKEWEEKPQEEKIVERIDKVDTDNDGTPNEYDCEPENENKQESRKMMMFRKEQLKGLLKRKYPNDYDKLDVEAYFDPNISVGENRRLIMEQAKQEGITGTEETEPPVEDIPNTYDAIRAQRKLEELEASGNIKKYKDVFDMKNLNVYDVDLPDYMVDQEEFDAKRLERYDD